MQIFELAKEYRGLLEAIDAAAVEGVEMDQEVMAQYLRGVELQGEQRVAAALTFDDMLSAMNDARRARIKQLQSMIAQTERVKEAARGVMLDWLRITNQRSIRTDAGTISVVKPRAQLVIDLNALDDWSVDFREAAIANGALKFEPKLNKNELRKLPGLLDQPGVAEVYGAETIAFRTGRKDGASD